jgi:hypothetical protein
MDVGTNQLLGIDFGYVSKMPLEILNDRLKKRGLL